MTEQEPVETGAQGGTEDPPQDAGEESTRLRDLSWSFSTAVSACVASLLIGGLIGASLGALAAGGDDDHRMVRQSGSERGTQQWRGERPGGPGNDQRRDWQQMPGMPGSSLGDEQRQELRERMRERMQQRGQDDGAPQPPAEPSTSPSPSASTSKS